MRESNFVATAAAIVALWGGAAGTAMAQSNWFEQLFDGPSQNRPRAARLHAARPQPSRTQVARVQPVKAETPRAGPESVPFAAAYKPGSIVIVNAERKLYYVRGDGSALRYGIAVGREDEVWTGKQVVTEKKENPRWVSPDGDDEAEPGPNNPLGLRALYLGWTLWRIHGTPSRHSIGHAVSNGCIRMRNEDVIDLYERVHVGAPVYAVKTLADATPIHWAKKISDQEE